MNHFSFIQELSYVARLRVIKMSLEPKSNCISHLPHTIDHSTYLHTITGSPAQKSVLTRLVPKPGPESLQPLLEEQAYQCECNSPGCGESSGQ